jgi:hypothetical protein
MDLDAHHQVKGPGIVAHQHDRTFRTRRTFRTLSEDVRQVPLTGHFGRTGHPPIRMSILSECPKGPPWLFMVPGAVHWFWEGSSASKNARAVEHHPDSAGRCKPRCYLPAIPLRYGPRSSADRLTAANFLETRFGVPLPRHWVGPLDLFGCDRLKPFARINRAGLLWLLDGRKLLSPPTLRLVQRRQSQVPTIPE